TAEHIGVVNNVAAGRDAHRRFRQSLAGRGEQERHQRKDGQEGRKQLQPCKHRSPLTWDREGTWSACNLRILHTILWGFLSWCSAGSAERINRPCRHACAIMERSEPSQLPSSERSLRLQPRGQR